jgi:hypothetical protein
LLKGREREQGRVQGPGAHGRASDENAQYDNKDHGNDDDASLRLHQGRQRQQSCVQNCRSRDRHGSVARRREDDDQDDVNNDGLHQMVQPDARRLPDNQLLVANYDKDCSGAEANGHEFSLLASQWRGH